MTSERNPGEIRDCTECVHWRWSTRHEFDGECVLGHEVEFRPPVHEPLWYRVPFGWVRKGCEDFLAKESENE